MKYEVITTNLCSKATTRHPNIQKTGDHIINIKCCGHLLFVTAIFETKMYLQISAHNNIMASSIRRKIFKDFCAPQKK